MTMTLDAFVGNAWEEHARDAAAVWARLPEALPLVAKASDLPGLAGLATHVSGEHLGRWGEGVRFLERLGALAVFDAASPEGKAVARSMAVLHVCAGDE